MKLWNGDAEKSLSSSNKSMKDFFKFQLHNKVHLQTLSDAACAILFTQQRKQQRPAPFCPNFNVELCYVIVIYGHTITVHSMLCRHFDIIRPTSGSLIKNARRWNVKAPLLSLLYLECMSLKTCCICPVFTFHTNTQFSSCA